MRVTVKPEVEAGLERGGEDLRLVVTSVHEGDTPPVNEPVEVFLAVEDAYEGASVELQGDLHPGDPGDTDEPFAKDVTVRYKSDAYEFEWVGSGADVLARETKVEGQRRTVESLLRDPTRWRFCHEPGKPSRLQFKLRLLVDGNAE